MFANTENSCTPEEYLLLEEKAEYKSEYHQGKIAAMAGASWKHNQIAGNVFNSISNEIETKPCYASISEMKLWIEKENRYTYPDVMINCGEPEFVAGRTDTITNPKVIIEVLSKSTMGDDKGDKFYASWIVDTLEEYVLIDQYKMRVEYFRRLDKKIWELRVFTKISDILTLNSIDVKIPLSKIYRSITWDE